MLWNWGEGLDWDGMKSEELRVGGGEDFLSGKELNENEWFMENGTFSKGGRGKICVRLWNWRENGGLDWE
jgi:hypothetical protein